MNWWQWTLSAVGVLIVLVTMYRYKSHRTTVADIWWYVDRLMSGTRVGCSKVKYQHRYSDYALELYRYQVDDRIDDASVLVLSEEWCYPGDFERAAAVLEKYGIEYRVVRPDDLGPRFLLVPVGKDIRKMCRAAMYILMDGFHLPYIAKMFQRHRFVHDPGEKADIERMLALAYPPSESSRDAASGIPEADGSDVVSTPALSPETDEISDPEPVPADGDSRQPRESDSDDPILIPRRLRARKYPESSDPESI